MIKFLWKYKYIFLSLISMLLLVSLNNFSGLKIFYESERIIELSNESQDIIDKSLDDKNLILLAIEFQDSVKYQDLLDLSNVSLKISKYQNTKSVKSIFNERVLIKSSVIPFAIKILNIDNYDKYKTSLLKIKKYGSKFADDDLHSFLFIIKSKGLESDEQKRDYLNKLEKEFSQNNTKVYITGQIKSEIYMQDNVTKELLLFIILSGFLCSLVLYFYLGNIKLVLINFISVCISLIFSFSLSNILFGGIELVMILIPAIVFIITISDFMHLLNSDKLYKNKFRSFKTQLDKIGMPVFITSLTTAIGFLSFMFSSLIPLFRFGFITTITIFISLFVIVILYSLIIDFNIHKNIKNNHFLDNLIVSPYTQTKPVGGPKQDDFINAVAVGQCQLSAVDLLTKLLSIEEQMGRVRDIKWGPRVIDLDLIVYGEQIINSDFLKLPHPLAKSREFVLTPWFAIDPEGEIPGAGKIKSLLASLNSQR